MTKGLAQMTSQARAARTSRSLVAAIALSAGLLGGAHGAVGIADAAKVAGLSDQPGVSRDYGTDTLSITLSPGNGDPLSPATGKVAGVTGNTAKAKTDTFDVTGDFDAEELVKSLNAAGFHIKVKK